MMSIWGKITPNGEKPEVGGKSYDSFYYSSSEGSILSGDGSGHVFNNLSGQFIEKEEYVPLNLAQDKIQEVITEYTNARQAYEENLKKLSEYHKNKLEQTNTYYQTLVTEMKDKALRHVDVQKQLRKESEDQLNKSLSSTEEQLEELRDTMAEFKMESQEEARKLKANLAERQTAVHRLTAEYEDMLQRHEVKVAMHDMLQQLDSDGAQWREYELQQYYTENFVEGGDRRMECQNILNGIIGSIEEEQHHNEVNTLRFELIAIRGQLKQVKGDLINNQDKLDEANNQHQQMVDLQTKHFDELKETIARYEDELAEMEEGHQGNMKRMKSKFSSILKISKASLQRAEVEVCIERSLMCPLLEREADGGGGTDSQTVARYEEKIRNMKVQFEEKMKKAKAKMALLQRNHQEEEEEEEEQEDLSKYLTEEDEKLLLQEQQLVASLKAVEDREAEEKVALQECVEARESVKTEIKVWTTEFKKEHGKDPEVTDKAAIKELYKDYKKASARSKEMEANVVDLADEKETTSLHLRSVTNRIEEGGIRNKVRKTDKPPALKVAAMVSSPRSVASSESDVLDHGANKSEKVKVVEKIVEKVVEVVVPAGTAEAIGAKLQVPMADAEVQANDGELETLLHRSALRRSGTTETDVIIKELEEAHKLDSDAIDELDNQLEELRKTYDAMHGDYEELAKEKKFVDGQLQTMTQAKRTDVVKRLEDDVTSMRLMQQSLEEQVALLETEKKKQAAKIKELNSRTEVAEKELKEKDLADQAMIAPGDEKLGLKKKITTQRDEIVMKSKAATAGWDAAAHADEQLDMAVKKAYKEGQQEERETHAKDFVHLNEAVEAKEIRITEMLVKIGEMEHQVLDATEGAAKAEKKMVQMQADLQETIAGLTLMQQSADDSADGGGASSLELDSLREELDQSQDELVATIEKCEQLEAEIAAMRKKNDLYEKLAKLTTGPGAAVAAPVAAPVPVASGKSHAAEMSEMILHIKKSIVKGTTLWKENKRDDCYELYLKLCEDVENMVYCKPLKDPMHNAVGTARASSSNKQKGAVGLRKALDKFLMDTQNQSIRKEEEAEVSKGSRGVVAASASVSSADPAAVKQLLQELKAAQMEVDEAQESAPSMREGTQAEGENEGEGEKKTDDKAANTAAAASSLLKRAKAAEEQVKSLRKQLAMVSSAAAAHANSPEGAVAPVAALSPTPGGRPGSHAGKRQAAPAHAPAAKGGGASMLEVRKLNQKIKELEVQLKKAGGSGGGGGGGDTKALQQQQRVMEKKMKEAELRAKKDHSILEGRAKKAEKSLAGLESTAGVVKKERDELREECEKLGHIVSTLDEFKEKAAKVEEIEGQMKQLSADMEKTQESFKKETMLRKKYKNELEDLKGAIRVYARCRPFAKYEIEKGCKATVEIKDDTSLKVITSRGDKDFEFDAVFDMASTQEAVFEDTKRLVESCLDGFNVCVFAYGQTGSGKTFTMTGSPALPGLTPRAIEELFFLKSEKPHLTCKITTYFMELYNDNLIDLYWVLDNKNANHKDPPPRLDIKMDNKKMVHVSNSIIKSADTPEELFELFNKGNLERHTGATQMNAESSRSHSIFAIMVESYDRNSKKTNFGKLSIVDLAGSERADKTGAAADRLKEAQSINKSLSALGDVISALSDGAKFVPYRNNKLTQLMQDSLGGNAKTLMFVNFSPADYNADETATSLTYAARVKKIVNNASKQAETEEVAKLKAIIKRLQGGQGIQDLEEKPVDISEEPEPPEDDGKVYDGY